jgi:hypothetical protein
MSSALTADEPNGGAIPSEIREVTVMTVFPTLGAYALGRLIGQMCGIRAGYGFFALGKLFAVLLIPLAVPLFAYSLLPGVIRRYRLTNRRVVVQKGLQCLDERWVDLDRFDAIDIDVLPGQAWYPAGDLIFRNGSIETFRLAGVSRPQTFRHTCLAARRGYLGARQSS